MNRNDYKNFTNEQYYAISSENDNIMISASAGSGKTQVLITRIIELIKEKKVKLNNILVVTFTNLASLEMKNRLTSELEKLAEKEMQEQNNGVNLQKNNNYNENIAVLKNKTLDSSKIFYNENINNNTIESFSNYVEKIDVLDNKTLDYSNSINNKKENNAFEEKVKNDIEDKTLNSKNEIVLTSDFCDEQTSSDCKSKKSLCEIKSNFLNVDSEKEKSEIFNFNSAGKKGQSFNLDSVKENNNYFSEQLEMISTADIFTFHKFCSKTIKEFFYETQTEPNFKLLNETQSEYLINESVNDLIDFYINKNDNEFNNLFRIFNTSRNENNFKEMLISLYNFVVSEEDEWLDNCFKKSYSVNLEENICAKLIVKYYKKVIENCIFELKMLKNNAIVCESLIMQGIIDEYINIIENINLENFLDIVKLKNQKIAYPTFRKEKEIEASKETDYIKNSLKNIRENISDVLNLFEYNSDLEFEKNVAEISNNLQTVVDVLKKFTEIYSAKKNENDYLDFNDLEHLCYKTLQNSKIRSTLQNRYKYIFIDEYQDTNTIQESIINKITGTNNLFKVGDVKQSIYMFRNSNPRIFLNKYFGLKEKNISGELIELNENFRSDKQILDFNNFVFNNIMRYETGEIDYKKSSQLSFGNKLIINEKSNYPVVSINLIDSEKTEKAENPLPKVYSVKNAEIVVNETDKIEKETILIVNEIDKLLKEKIFDKEINGYRNIEYSDIGILSRKRSKVIEIVTKTLVKANIPVCSEFLFNLFDETEIKFLMNYLKILDNFNLDIPLCAILNSFICDISKMELLNIRNEFNKEFLYESVLEYAKNKDDEIANKIKKLQAELADFKNMSLYTPLQDLVQKIIEYYSIDLHFISVNKNNVETNFEIFKQNIKNSACGSICSYINFVDEFANKKTFNAKYNSGKNSVQITTIHSSKGLEFPVVFLVNAEATLQLKDIREKLLKNSVLGINLKHYNLETNLEKNNFITNAFKLEMNNSMKQEELRLLYVALTRAKYHLIICGTKNLDEIEKLYTDLKIMNVGNYLDWIMGSFDESTINSIKMREKDNFIVPINNFSKVEINVFKPENIQLNRENIDIKKDDISSLKSAIKKAFSYKPKENNLQFKNTVTALMEEENRLSYNITDFKISGKNMSLKTDEDFSLLIGNGYHLAMQNADFNSKNLEEIKNNLSILKNNNTINEEQFNLIESEKILTACKKISDIISENDRVYREKMFMIYMPINSLVSAENTEKVLVQGVVDLMIEKENEIILIDYKTSKLNNENEFQQHYKVQLEVYAKAIESAFKKKVSKKYIYSFYKDMLIIV